MVAAVCLVGLIAMGGDESYGVFAGGFTIWHMPYILMGFVALSFSAEQMKLWFPVVARWYGISLILLLLAPREADYIPIYSITVGIALAILFMIRSAVFLVNNKHK